MGVERMSCCGALTRVYDDAGKREHNPDCPTTVRGGSVSNHFYSYVKCAHCGTLYDLGRVTVTGRYADCTLWRTPCCNRPVDDRKGWGQDHYTQVNLSSAELMRGGQVFDRMPGEDWGHSYVPRFAPGHFPKPE